MLTQDEKRILVERAKNYDTVEAFITEIGWYTWMMQFMDNPDSELSKNSAARIEAILRAVYEIA